MERQLQGLSGTPKPVNGRCHAETNGQACGMFMAYASPSSGGRNRASPEALLSGSTRRNGHLAIIYICKKAFALMLVAALPLLPGTARGSDANRSSFTVLSEGATTCGEFIAQPAMQAVRMEWVLGYISGRNREAISPREKLIGSSFQRTDTVISWLQSYCQSHSLETLITAADDLRADFQRHEGR